jgi:aspartyl-tRNA(Asn)/glutamyl-tRNA(Gln) amidotransferase subunit C
MSVDSALVHRIAHLSRIKVEDAEIERLAKELGSILDFVEALKAVDVEGAEPLTSVLPMQMKKRADVVNDGGKAEEVLANAPERDDQYFVVPKVIE